MDKLKDCPFCGGEASKPVRSSGSDERNGYNFTVSIFCKCCGVSIRCDSATDAAGWCKDTGQALENAVSAWNRRAAPAQGDAVPDGWQLVPKEPTQEMHNAARDWSVAKYGIGVGIDGSDGCYRAMLAGAPDLPTDATRQSSADAVDAARWRAYRVSAAACMSGLHSEALDSAVDKIIDSATAIAAQGGKGGAG